MRAVCILCFSFALAAPAAAQRLPLDLVPDPVAVLGELPHLPHLQLSTALLDVDIINQALPAATPSIVVPPRYGWALDDGRAFWFAAGASSVVALGTHVLVGLPTLGIAAGGTQGLATSSPAAQLPLLFGIGGAYMLAESALASLASLLVFNGVSKIYDGNYLVTLAAHVAGTLLGVAVSALSFGVGVMLLGGLEGLREFTGGAGIQAIGVFSVLGALPAVVMGGIALVGVPAIIGAWAMSVSASPKPGYAIDRAWRDPVPMKGAAAPVLTMPIPGS